VSPRALVATALGLARLSLIIGAAVAVSFGLAAYVLDPIPAAAAGLVGYALLLLAARSLGLGEAWAYVRRLH
jgi:hypothetical protein